MKNIEIFTGPACAYCEAAKAMLKSHGLAYRERDVSDPAVQDEFRKRLPRVRSIPQIFIDGEHIGNDQDLKRILDEQPR